MICIIRIGTWLLDWEPFPDTVGLDGCHSAGNSSTHSSNSNASKLHVELDYLIRAPAYISSSTSKIKTISLVLTLVGIISSFVASRFPNFYWLPFKDGWDSYVRATRTHKFRAMDFTVVLISHLWHLLCATINHSCPSKNICTIFQIGE